MIELRLLQYFVAVAETEHLGHAAQRLHVSASPLSRQIRQLEDALGLRLFAREKQRLRLTPEGRWLLERAQRLLASAATLADDAARYARGETGSLRIGFVNAALWSELLPGAIRRYRAAHPQVTLHLVGATSADQLALLRRGELDLGVVHVTAADPALVSTQVATERLLLALPSDHPLVARRSVAPKDLDGKDWIALGPREARSHAALLATCARAGFTPRVRLAANDQGALLGLVAAGLGLAFVPASAAAATGHGVVLRRLAWLRASRALHLVARVDGSAAARAFVAAVAPRSAVSRPR